MVCCGKLHNTVKINNYITGKHFQNSKHRNSYNYCTRNSNSIEKITEYQMVKSLSFWNKSAVCECLYALVGQKPMLAIQQAKNVCNVYNGCPKRNFCIVYILMREPKYSLTDKAFEVTVSNFFQTRLF